MRPSDIRALLEGYDIDDRTVLARTGTLVSGDATITAIDTSSLLPLMSIAGPGIPAGALIASVGDGEIEMDKPASANGTTVNLKITTYSLLSDDWLTNLRDEQIIPWVEERIGLSLSGQTRIIEYHSGTGSSLLILNHKPIVSMESINLITNPSNWVYVSPTSVELIKEEGIIKLRAVLESWQSYVPAFPRGKDNIKVDYTYGFATCPDDIARVVKLLTASFALGFIGARTGGGSVSVQGFNRGYGNRGKYSDIRIEFERWAMSLMRKYITTMAGS